MGFQAAAGEKKWISRLPQAKKMGLQAAAGEKIVFWRGVLGAAGEKNRFLGGEISINLFNFIHKL